MAATPTRTLSLRTRWTLTLIAAAAIPMGLFGTATLRIQRDGLEHAEQLHEFAVLDHVVDTIEASLRSVSEASHRVGMVLTDARITDDDAKLQLAQETMANASALAQVAIYLADGSLVDTVVRRHGESVLAAPSTVPHADVPEGQDGIWLPVEYRDGSALLRYLEPIKRDGELRAWVLATVAPRAIPGQLAEISRDRFENRVDGVIVLDATGKILASSAPTGPLAASNSLLGRDLLSVVHLRPEDFGRNSAYSAQFVAGGETMVGTIRTMPQRNWAVLARRPAAAVFASLARSRQSLGIAAAGLLVFALGLASILVARTVRPIQALIRLASAYGLRQFKQRSAVRTGDEIELLGNQMMDMADNIERSEAEVERRIKVEADLARFMPAQVAIAIASGEKSLALGGERRAITVLFADVASFTPFAESTDPERVVAFLNELFGVLTELVFRYEGTVDKFIGDSVMAVFGAPNDQPDHAQRAISAADDMQRFVDSSKEQWKARYGLEPALAIGVNSGEALVGNLGSPVRMEYTCVGDVVNVASRLEGLARPGQILVTQAVVSAVGDGFDFAALGEHAIRGKKQGIALFEVVR